MGANLQKTGSVGGSTIERWRPLGSRIASWTSELLVKGDRVLNVTEARIGAYVEEQGAMRAVVHEKVLYMLEAVALIYSGDEGATPSDGQLAFLALAANDYVDDWYDADERKLLPHEDTLAGFADAARFNQQRDPLVAILRARGLLSSPVPRSNDLSDPSLWRQLQETAFGRSFLEHFDLFLLPMLLYARAYWGTEAPDGSVRMPELHPETWSANSAVTETEVESFFGPIVLDRAGAQRGVRFRSDGLPHAPTFLLKRPLVRCSEGTLVATSPWAVFRQLHTGLWFRFLSAAKELGLVDTWNPAFGLLFEGWCQRIARLAQANPNFVSDLHLPSEPGGNDEIEDVVVLGSDAAVFLSVKSRLVRESAARDSLSRNAIWDWYADVLFGATKPGYRHGWLRQLDEKIRKARAGHFEPTVHRNTLIFPVVVMYDDTAESPMLYDLIDETCRAKGILYNQRGVAPVTVCSVGDFEGLMAAGAKGIDIVSIMKAKVGSEWRRQRLSVYLFEECAQKDPTFLRLAALEDEFGALVEDAMRRLFPTNEQDGESSARGGS